MKAMEGAHIIHTISKGSGGGLWLPSFLLPHACTHACTLANMHTSIHAHKSTCAHIYPHLSTSFNIARGTFFSSSCLFPLELQLSLIFIYLFSSLIKRCLICWKLEGSQQLLCCFMLQLLFPV